MFFAILKEDKYCITLNYFIENYSFSCVVIGPKIFSDVPSFKKPRIIGAPEKSRTSNL